MPEELVSENTLWLWLLALITSVAKDCRFPLREAFFFISCTFCFSGRAFLFHKVVNLVYSEVQDRVMLTGRHMVRDVSCKNCSTKLGWVYEFATEENQRYILAT